MELKVLITFSRRSQVQGWKRGKKGKATVVIKGEIYNSEENT